MTPSQRLTRSAARTLAEAGLVEVLTYPFVGAKDYEAFRTGEAGHKLANPLSADRPDMRSNILITLLDAAKRNFQRGVSDFGLFEIGLVTLPQGRDSAPPPDGSAQNDDVVTALQAVADNSRHSAANHSVADHPSHSEPVLRAVAVASLEEAQSAESLAPAANPVPAANLVPPVGARPDAPTLQAIQASIPDQPRQVAAVLVGEVEPSGWWGKGRKADWSDALGLVQRIADRANVTLSVARQTQAGPSWHPGRTAVLGAAENPAVVLGVAGELHPKVAANFGLPGRPVAFELNLSALNAVREAGEVKATPVSAYPVAKEDFAFVVPQQTPAQVVETAIVQGAGDLLETAELFDIYSGEQLGEGRKSLAYSVRLRAADRTLTDDDVKATRENIIAAAKAAGAELRA